MEEEIVLLSSEKRFILDAVMIIFAAILVGMKEESHKNGERS